MQSWSKTAIAAGAVLTALTGCHSAESTPPPAPIKSAACMDPTANVVITDPTNYSLTDSFDIKTFTLKDNTNLVFDWSALNKDFFGHTVNLPTDINLILVALWHMTPAQIEDALKADDIPLSSNAGVITALTSGKTSVNLSDFTLLGQSIPTDLIPMYFDTSTPNYQYPQDQFTFMMMASTGTTPGKGPRGIALFHIDPGASATTLAMTPDSTKLSYSVNLTKGAPVLVPASTPKLTVDWSQMMHNMIGNKYDFSQITRAAVAHFKNQTLEDLQSKFLDLETLADDWWQSTAIAGSSVDLSTLAKTSGSSSGETFPGIDASGIWMTALFCDNCNNPAPWSITIMQPCQ
jgi:hypothetical protein